MCAPQWAAAMLDDENATSVDYPTEPKRPCLRAVLARAHPPPLRIRHAGVVEPSRTPRPDPQTRRSFVSLPFLDDVLARARRPRRERRRTRIVATIGPASSSPETLAALVEVGMDVARVSFAHGTTTDAIKLIRQIRKIAPHIGILPDLPGPKIRSSPFPERGVVLRAGAELVLAPGSTTPTSSATRIGVAVDEVVISLAEGDFVSLGDGGVSLVVVGRRGDEAVVRVRAGGRIMGRTGVTVPSSRFQLATPTPEDLDRIAALAAEEVAAIAVSFVRGSEDIDAVRDAIGNSGTMLVAKIETPEAIDNLDAIVRSADAVMVARGDLGMRLPLEDVPFHQKQIIRSGVRFGRPVITATQMLESMITSLVPTRAEVTDVANAVLDGTSAVMLSGETAIGVDPVLAVSTMARIVERAERDFDYLNWGAGLGVQEVSGDLPLRRITAAITGAAWHAALEQDVAAIIACTQSGATARAISRFRPSMPIVAVTPSERTFRQLSMSWGVETLLSERSADTDGDIWLAVQQAVGAGFASPGDVVVVIAGSPYEQDPVADTLRIVRIR
jgi:pyruvate kinase